MQISRTRRHPLCYTGGVTQHFLPFVGLVTVLVAIPGPAVTLIMKNAFRRLSALLHRA